MQKAVLAAALLLLPGSLARAQPSVPLNAAEARALLAAHGYAQVRRLERIGDYWEGEVPSRAGPVTVYAFDDGEVLRAPPLIGAP